MTTEELKKKLKDRKFKNPTVVIGERSYLPNIIGMFKENGVWNLYRTKENHTIVLLKKGTESEIANALYFCISELDKDKTKKPVYEQLDLLDKIKDELKQAVDSSANNETTTFCLFEALRKIEQAYSETKVLL